MVFSDFDVVEPDLLYMSTARAAEILTAKHVRGVPELVVEISSRSTRKRDETIKRRLYERAGVTEYWVADAELDVVRICRRADAQRVGQRFERAIELRLDANDALTTPLLPGLEIPLARVSQEPGDPRSER